MKFAPKESRRFFSILSAFVEAFETLAKVHPAVNIFGSALASPSEPLYEKVLRLARSVVKMALA